MTSIKNHKTALVAISAIASVLVVSTIAMGSGRIALADFHDDSITKNFNNTGVNVQTSTNQEQKCDTAGGSSGISGSCTATPLTTLCKAVAFTTNNPKYHHAFTSTFFWNIQRSVISVSISFRVRGSRSFSVVIPTHYLPRPQEFDV